MKFIIILIILIFQSACEKSGFKINQVIDKEQLYKFKAKSKIYSLKIMNLLTLPLLSTLI